MKNHPDNDRERAIANDSYRQGVLSVLSDLFERSDKKRVIRALWAKTMNLVSNNTTKYTQEELRAYASGVLHCYEIMKMNDDALSVHNDNALTWDKKPTPFVHIPLTEDDLKMLGQRSGH